MRPIHDRMPVILEPEDFERWLDPGKQDPLDLLRLLRPVPSEGLEAYPVSKAVNSPRNGGKGLIERPVVSGEGLVLRPGELPPH